MGIQPASTGFRMLCGAAIAYGLTEGGYNADTIEITQLGRRIVSPLKEGDDQQAMREALLRPRVIREFLTKYDGSKFPRDDIAQNILIQLGVPKDATERVFKLIKEGAAGVGFIKEISGVAYVDLRGIQKNTTAPALLPEGEEFDAGIGDTVVLAHQPQAARTTVSTGLTPPPKAENRKVFVTHGKNKGLVPQLKELLIFGKFEPIVSVERESLSKPVPDKVMDDMRLCGAAIIHVDADREMITPEGEKEVILNSNVLIEIGGAMALYNRKFILLVQRGVRLPSNLQGLYEVRYEGDKLDGDATLRLLKAFNEFNT
ncbi:TIR domain-containing protein [Myxococcus virescens]|uniref:TIR domain-containing protein n=1 Tax=Myxococcus virescens TaxID=83456 RepID=UPI003DA2175D